MEEEGAEELSKSEQEWYDYFRALFPKVKSQHIKCTGLIHVYAALLPPHTFP